MDEQLLRIVLPTALLNDLDDVLAREGSGRSRADFVREAVEQRMMELQFGEAASTPVVMHSSLAERLAQPPLASEEGDLSEHPLLRPRSLVDTRLPPPGGATVAQAEAATLPVEPGPLFLHGRDYPSLWCLWWLAQWADEGPLELGAYLREVTLAAWNFAERVREFDRPGELKPATMFPTSTRNPDSASQTFQSAAIGGVVRRRDGSQVVVGPLALWDVARIYPWRTGLMIAPTEEGLELLTRLENLSLELPHAGEHAEVFLQHLRAHAPTDHSAFVTVLQILADEPNRQELIERLAATEVPEAKLADVYAQAYVARGREWGLIEPKLIGRRYLLTPLAASMLGG